MSESDEKDILKECFIMAELTNKKNGFKGNGDGRKEYTTKKPYKKNYGNTGAYKSKKSKGPSIKNKKMSFNDLCVNRELQALDKAWDEYVSDMYYLMLKGACEESVDNVFVVIEAARPFYIQAREKIKARFSLNQQRAKEREEKEDGEVHVEGLENFSYSLIADNLVEEKMDEVEDEHRDADRGFIFNEHPEVKERTSDRLEEFLRRTLKEDE